MRKALLWAWLWVSLLTLPAMAGAAPLFPLTVQLDWVANAQFAGLLVAKEKGWYAEQGLDVTIEPVNQTTLDTVGPVVRGHHVIGCADGLVLLRARQAGQPIQAFATMLQASPLGIVTLRNGPLSRVGDLAGKTIGLHAYDLPQLDVMLKANGLSLARVRTKTIGDDTTSLAAGTIDAQVVYLIDEKIALENKGIALHVFPGYANNYRTYSQAYFARADFLEGHPEILARFLRASNRGWQEAFAHPEQTATMLVATYLPGGNVRYQADSLRELQPYTTLESPQLGQMRLMTWKRSCALFHLDAALAGELANFSVLRLLYGKDNQVIVNTLQMPLLALTPGCSLAAWPTRVKDFAAFVSATGYDATGNMLTLGKDDYDWLAHGHTWASPGFAQTADHPVVGVSCDDAMAFCVWLTARERGLRKLDDGQSYGLPTDLEWSLAVGLDEEEGAWPEARLYHSAGTYPWGSHWPPPANFGNYAGAESRQDMPSWWGVAPGGYTDQFPRTSPVGSFAPNARGFYDLSGNVWEWCADAYCPGSLAMIIRGGSWGSDRPAYLQSANRNPKFPDSRNDETGFRIALRSAG